MRRSRLLPLIALLVATGVSAQDDTQEFLKKIENLISDHNYHAASNSHYVIKTDDPRLDIDAVAGLLDSFYGYFESFWSNQVTLRDPGDRSRIYLFYSMYKYKQLLEFKSDDHVEPVGHYTAYRDIVALHTDSVGLQNLPDLLLHEAAHQLVQVRLYGKDYMPSPWVAEGLASYFGSTLRDKSGEFRTGTIGGKGTTFFDGVSATSRGTASGHLVEYRRALKKGETTPLEEIIAIEGEDFYGKQGAVERYTASWLLVHYLLHADEGAHAPSFVRYLQHEAEGKDGPALFFDDIGMTPAQLAPSFAAYVSTLKAR